MNPVGRPMTEGQRKLIFVVAKVAWVQTGASEDFEDWRREQQRSIGIQTLTNCTLLDGLRLTKHFEGMISEKEAKKLGPARGRKTGIIEWAGDRSPQVRKVYALLADMKLPWDYADAIAKRMFGSGVFRVETLNSKQLQAVITALVKRQEKLKKEKENEHERG